MVLLVGSIGYSFFRLRFIYALSVMWALYAEFILLTALTGSYSDVRSFAVAIVLLAVACSIYSWFAYWREFYIRKGFLMNLNLKREERNHNRFGRCFCLALCPQRSALSFPVSVCCLLQFAASNVA